MTESDHPRCGAKTRKGKLCQKIPMAGMKRCRLHGGVTKTKGTDSITSSPASLYSKYYTADEVVAASKVEPGSVDAELVLVRTRLARALAMEKLDREGGLHPELESKIERDGGGPMVVSEERHYRMVDYRSAIHACLARIESLEKTRMELNKAGGGGNEDVAAQLRSLADRLPV